MNDSEATRRLLSRSGRAETTSVRFDETDGVTLALRTSAGFVALFDLHSPHLMLARDQGSGLPIRPVRLHNDRKHCMSADPRSVKVWDRNTGVNLVAIELDADITHLSVMGNSGVMWAAVEAPRMKTFYMTALVVAPK